MKSQHKLFLAGSLVLLLFSVFANPLYDLVYAQDAPARSLLSSYWEWSVLQWDSLIVQEAERRNVDPDLLASLVWQESRGDAAANGPKGAVGLMQIMPQEEGFDWRPTREELLDPETNLFWGTRTIATVILQGQGDLFNALAAYNGGWDKVTQSAPRQYATTVLRDYAAAVATDLDVSGRWVAYFAVQQGAARGPIWVADAARSDIYFFGSTNRLPDGSWLIPYRTPTAIVAHCVDEETGAVFDAAMWLYDSNERAWLAARTWPALEPTATATPSATPTSSETPTVLVTETPVASVTPEVTETPAASVTASATPTLSVIVATSATPSPTATPTTTPTPRPTASSDVGAVVLDDGSELRPGPTMWWDVSDTLSAGTELVILGYDPAVEDWIYVRTLAGRDGWALLETLDVLVDLDDVPLTTPQPTMTPSSTPSPTPTLPPTNTPKPQIACNGDPFFAEAWPMDKFNTEDGGWKAIIFARGYEGTCNYTYAWDDPENIVGGPTYQPVMFEISIPRRDAAIVGSVIVSDGETSVSVGLFIHPPDSGL